jgi:hypothetical protein
MKIFSNFLQKYLNTLWIDNDYDKIKKHTNLLLKYETIFQCGLMDYMIACNIVSSVTLDEYILNYSKIPQIYWFHDIIRAMNKFYQPGNESLIKFRKLLIENGKLTTMKYLNNYKRTKYLLDIDFLFAFADKYIHQSGSEGYIELFLDDNYNYYCLSRKQQ